MSLLQSVLFTAASIREANPALSGSPFLSKLHTALLDPQRSVVRNAVLDTMRCPLLVVTSDEVVVLAAECAGTRESLERSVRDWAHAGADAVVVLVSRRRLMLSPPMLAGCKVRYLLVGPDWRDRGWQGAVDGEA